MLLKRHIPLLIVIGVGLLTLFGHFFNNDSIQAFVDKDALQWFDIIASFAIFAGFFYRGANFITLSDIKEGQLTIVSEIIAEELNESNPYSIRTKLEGSQNEFEIDKVYMTSESAKPVMEKLNLYVETIELKSKPWGAHVQTMGSLFYWMFINIITPLGATMFALLAFFVASASYRAFRIRNFEATLLLVAGIILMLGRVPIGGLIPWWVVSIMVMFGIGAIAAPFIKERTILLGIVAGGILIFIITGTFMGWNQNPPDLLSIPVIQDWIFAYPTLAGSRALMIGIALGIVATSFRIIIGLDKSFLGEK